MSNVGWVPAGVLAGLALLGSGACRQPWKFARPDDPVARIQARRPRLLGVANAPEHLAAAPESCRGAAFDPVGPLPDDGSCAPPSFRTRLRWRFDHALSNIRSDHRGYYGCGTMRDLALGLGAAAVLANTSLDQDFQDWYGREVRSSGTQDLGEFWERFGDGRIFVPGFVGLSVVGRMHEQRPLFNLTGEYASRVSRSYLVGAPPMVFTQFCLGGSRPSETGGGSQWKPFQDGNGVSGHAFVGAVPFITAARMTENPWLKGGFYFFSFLTPWSRIEDDGHYLSQAWLGWWMAYLACRAVDGTQDENRSLRFTPVATPEVAGMGVEYRR